MRRFGQSEKPLYLQFAKLFVLHVGFGVVCRNVLVLFRVIFLVINAVHNAAELVGAIPHGIVQTACEVFHPDFFGIAL